MTTYHGALEKETMSLLAAPMKEANSNMAKKAYKFLSKEVRIWHWCTIKAFIRRGGKYQSKVVGHQSWNAKMMLPAAKFMSSAWDELIRKEDAANKVFFATIVTALGGTLEDVKGMLLSKSLTEQANHTKHRANGAYANPQGAIPDVPGRSKAWSHQRVYHIQGRVC